MNVEDVAIKPKQFCFRHTVYSVTEKTQFSEFMFIFAQVVQRHLVGEVG